MRLRVKEHFHMAHIVSRRALQVGPCEIVKVLLVQQNRHALVIDVEEFLQVREGVCGLGLFERAEGGLDLVAFGNLHHQLRFKAALDVKVKLCLGQFSDECGAVSHSGPPEAVRYGVRSFASDLTTLCIVVLAPARHSPS